MFGVQTGNALVVEIPLSSRWLDFVISRICGNTKRIQLEENICRVVIV